MSRALAEEGRHVIASIRRGPGPDLASITFVAADGRALHATVYGLNPDETIRNREELVRWLTATGIPLVDHEGRQPAGSSHVIARPRSGT